MLGKEFFTRHPLACAAELIGCELVWDHCSGIIVETEAYTAIGDEACHTFSASRGAEVRGYPSGRDGLRLLELRRSLAAERAHQRTGGRRLRVDPRPRTPSRRAAHAGAPLAGRPDETVFRSRQTHAGARNSGDVPRVETCARIPSGRSTRDRRTWRHPRWWRMCASASRARRICRGVFSPPGSRHVSRRPTRAATAVAR